MENRNPDFQEVQQDKIKTPTFMEIQSFFNEEYTFIKKWMAVNEPDWDELLSEARVIESEHPFKYCLDRITSSVILIQKSYMERGCNNG